MSESRPVQPTDSTLSPAAERPVSVKSTAGRGLSARQGVSADRKVAARSLTAPSEVQPVQADLLLPASDAAASAEPSRLDLATVRRLRRVGDDETDAQREFNFDSIDAPISAVPTAAAESPVLLAQAAAGAATEAAGSAAGAGASAGTAAAGAGAAAGLATIPPIAIGGLVVGGALVASSSSSSAAPTPAADTTAPTLVSTKVSSTNGTITLTFSEALNPDKGTLKASDFVVKVGETTIASTDITDVSIVAGNTVVLTFKPAIIPAGNINLSLAYTDPSGDGASTLQDTAGNDVASFSISQGVVADGYIRGAQIYIDSNANGVADASEKIDGVVTDSFGRFFLPGNAPKGSIIAVGGVNIDTGLPNLAPLKAPAGSTTVNPLTTLVQAVVEKSGAAATDTAAIKAAANQVAATLGLPASVANGGNLLNFDPMKAEASGNAADALAVQKAAAKVATIVSLAGSDTATASKLVSNLATTVQESRGTTLNLADGNVLSGALKNVTGVSVEARASVVDAVTAIADSNNISGISNVQSQYLDKIAPLAPSLVIADRVNSLASSIKVSLNVSTTDGTAVVVGDTIRLYEGGVQVASASVADADIAAGFKVVAVTGGALIDKGYSFTAQVVDKSGNSSALSSAAVTQLDTTAPKSLVSNSVGVMTPGGKSVLTVTLSEAVEGFDKSDINVSGGTLGTLSAPQTLASGQVVYTIDYTAPSTQGALKVSVGTGYTDLAKNQAQSASPEIDLSVDSAPVALITDNVAGTATGPATFTVAFSEKVTGFDISDLTISGGSSTVAPVLKEIAAGQLYTVVVTPAASSTADIGVTLKAGSVTDIPVSGSGQTNVAVTVSQAVDTQAPVVSIKAAAGDNKVNAQEYKTILQGDAAPSPILVEGTATEANALVSLTLGANNVRSFNASSTAVEGVYSWSYKLTQADIKALGEGEKTISAIAIDAAGNSSAAVASLKLTIGTVAPALTPWALLDASDSGVKSDGRTSVAQPSIVFAAPTGSTVAIKVFDSANTLVSQQSATGTGADQTVQLSAPLTAQGEYRVTLSVTDAALNNTERTSRFTLDTAGPSISSITDDKTALVGLSTGNITFTFNASEASNGFTVDDVTVVGGKSVGALKQISGTEFALTVAPDAGLEGTDGKVSVSVAAGKFTDLAGNTSSASSVWSQDIDTKRPVAGTLPSASIPENKSDGTFLFAANDANPLTWTVAGTDASLVTIDSATRIARLKSTPDFETKSSYDFTVVATDSAGNATEIPFKLSVQNLDEKAPTITSADKGSIAENASISTVAYKVASTDTEDIATGSTSYSIKPGLGDASMFDINASTGEIKLKEQANYEVKWSYGLTVVATDAANNAREKAITIDVTDVNEAPVKTQAAPSTPQIVVVGQPLSGASVAPWFSDPDTRSVSTFGKLSYSVSPALPNGLVLNKDTGEVTGTVTTAFNDTVVTFSASDGTNPAVSHEVTVKAVTAPVVQSFTVADTTGATNAGRQGEALTFTVKLSEAVAVTGTPSLGVALGSGTTAVLTASLSAGNNTDTLTFTGIAPAGDGALKLVSIGLTDSTIVGKLSGQPIVATGINQTAAGYLVDNTAPSISTSTLSVAENATAVGQVVAATDATPITYTRGTGGDSSLFQITSAGALSLIAQKDFEAEAAPRQYTVSVIPSDAAGNIGTAKVITVSLTDVNESAVSVPVDSNAAANTVVENAATNSLVGLTASATDADGTNNTVSYSLVTSTGAAYTGSEFSINSSSGVVSVAGPINFEVGSTRALYVKATSTDGSTATNTTPFTISVTDVNEAPAPQGDVGAQTAVNGQAFTLNLASKFADPDSAAPFNTVTYAVTTGTLPAGLSLNAATGVLSGTATANASPASLTVTATDGGQLTGTQTFTLQVVSAPVLQSFTVSDAVGSATAGKSGDALTFTTRFTEAVNVAGGTPKIIFKVMNNGQVAESLEATYVSGTGTDTLVFSGTAPNASGSFAVQSIQLPAGTTVIGKLTSQALVTTSVGQADSVYSLDSTVPTISAPSTTTVSVAENATKVADLVASEPVTWSVSGSGFSLASGSVSATNTLNFSTPKNYEVTADRTNSVTVTATDASGNSRSTTLTVNISDVDEFDTVFNTPTDSNTAANTVPENAAAGTSVGITASAADADGSSNVVTYALVATAQGNTPYTGSEFTIEALTGVIKTGSAGLNYEALPADGKTKTLYVLASSQDGSTAVATYTVNVTDVNEAPVPVTGDRSYTAVVNQALSNQSIAGLFADPDANATLTYSVKAGSTLPAGLSLSSAGALTGTATAAGSVSVTFVASDGALSAEKLVTLSAVTAPTLNASSLDNVTNLDPTSNIVLTFSEGVSGVAGKFIRIVNDANTTSANGFHSETSVNTLLIEASSSQLSFSVDKKAVIINPTADFDLSNNYHLEIDAGAFVGTASLQPTTAFNGLTSLNFSTVTPKAPASSSAPSAADGAESLIMTDAGALVASRVWLDIEGIGNPAGTSKVPIDLGAKAVTLVAKDYDSGGAVANDGYDGIKTANVFLAVSGFSSDDLLYIDNQSSVSNDLSLTAISNAGVAPTTFQFAGTELGGFFDITVAGSSAAFDTINAFKGLLGGNSAPVISA